MLPFLYAGSSDPKILIIAQNPGEIGSGDTWRPILSKYADSIKSANELKVIYDIDFVTSHGHTAMESIFGEDWLMSGDFMYTNAVRCRTPGNASPSDQMIDNCMGWTSQLPIPDLVVLMGGIARKQFCKMVKKPELQAFKVVKFMHNGTNVHVATIPHYAALKSKADVQKAKETYEEALEKAGLS